MLNLKSRIFNILKLSGFVAAHISAIGVLSYAFLPIAKWYLLFRPLWGVDYFLLASLSSLVKSHLVAPYALWNYAWFGGLPIFIYPILHSYVVNLLTAKFDLIFSVGLWMMISTLLFVIGAYFLFFAISKNLILAVILAVATAYSAGVYQTLTWAGSMPSYATQAAFPWVLAFLVWYLKGGYHRFLLASALIAGVSVWGHPLVFVIYIIPATLLLIITRFDKGLAILPKVKASALFLMISILVALPLFYTTFKASLKSTFKPTYTQGALSTTSTTPTELEIGIANFNKAQVKRAISDNNNTLFILLGFTFFLYILGLAIGRKLASIFEVLPYFLIAAYFAFYIWLFGQGISIFHGGWYRLYWSVPIWVGMLASVLWREALRNFFATIKSKSLQVVLLVGSTLAVLALGVTFLIVEPAGLAIVKIVYRSQVSSAHPDILNLKVADSDRSQLKTRLVPSWINGDETNWRIYAADQLINIWWQSIFKMPLARGYIDPGDLQKGYVFWLDSAMSQTEGEAQLVKNFEYPLETAISNALFLIDWYAIRYFEGGHESSSYTPVPKYLKDIVVKREEIMDFGDLRYSHRPQTLNYYEFKEELTSPVLSATNASTLGIFATDSGFETVIRAISEKDNLNSQKIISIKLGKTIDNYDLKSLANFDALYLYDYDYKKKDKAYKLLTGYVQRGKKVFVDTGVEVKESDGDLPEFFPVKKVQRRGMGKVWTLEATDQTLAGDVDFEKFAPPVFDEDEWKLSYADEAALVGGATPILKNQGKVVMARGTIGSGEVIWSGLNFAYHVSRNHNWEEAKFFVNILSSLVDLSKKPQPNFSVDFKNANSRTISAQGAKGILFKEMAYGGWSANLIESDNAKRGKLKIFKAGPAYPGYMYIPTTSGKNVVSFKFSGSLQDKLLTWVSMIVVLLVLDEAALGGLILGRLRRVVFKLVSFKIGRWWQKEDE